jgi:hypothetical protein
LAHIGRTLVRRTQAIRVMAVKKFCGTFSHFLVYNPYNWQIEMRPRW